MGPLREKTNKVYKYFIVFTGFLLVVLFSITDKYISHHPALIIFYVIPVSLVTWFSGAIAGIFIACCSVVAWFPNDIAAIKSLYTYPIFFYLNMAVRGSFLFIVIYVLQRLKTALRHEKELNDLKSAFVADASHELKSPLSIIREIHNLILDGLVGDVEPKQRELLERGKRSVERLIRLITNLLDVSKIEAGKMAVLMAKVDVASLVIGILKDYGEVISKKQLVLKTDIQKDVGFLWGDKDKLEQVITNLLSNAIKYSPSGGDIAIKVTGTDSEIRFEVSDVGPGIAKSDVDKLFNKYERIIAEKQEGTGLGLSIAKSIIELHNGRLWVESAVGKGSKFIFTLPRRLERKQN